MYLIYSLYFAALNFMLFTLLTKKIELTVKVKVGLLLFLIVVMVLHFVTTSLSNRHFLHLNMFSLALLIFHFGSVIAIWAMIKINPHFKDHMALSGFNFLRFYVIYILVYCYQLISLFSTGAREHFNSI